MTEIEVPEDRGPRALHREGCAVFEEALWDVRDKLLQAAQLYLRAIEAALQERLSRGSNDTPPSLVEMATTPELFDASTPTASTRQHLRALAATSEVLERRDTLADDEPLGLAATFLREERTSRSRYLIVAPETVRLFETIANELIDTGPSMRS